MRSILTIKACAFPIFPQDPHFSSEALSPTHKFLMNDKEFPFLICIYNR